MRPPSSCVVYTPSSLANAMADSLQPRVGDSFLDPCIGRGSLVKALARRGIPSHDIRAIDIDSRRLETDKYAEVVRGRDFLRWSCDTEERFDKVIANPPYLALNRLRGTLRKSAKSIRFPFNDEALPLTGNYWHSFLCAALRVLKKNGSICFLLPAAWDFSNYAESLRDELPKHFASVSIHRSQQPLFKGLQEGSVVLIAKGFRRKNHTIRRIEHKNLRHLVEGLRQPTMVGTPKTPDLRSSVHDRECRLGDLIEIPIGAVTGDSKFFLLTNAERLSRGLPSAACVPVLTRAAHLQTAYISAKSWQLLRDQGHRVWLFRPSKKQSALAPVRRYLRYGAERGGCRKKGYKIQLRSTWYQTRMPESVHGFMSGMSTGGPWLAISKMPELSASNTLYTVRFKSASTFTERAAIGVGLMTSHVRSMLAILGRQYADGLIKFEPGDLSEIRVPIVQRTKGITSRYRLIISQWLSGNRVEAQRLADEWVLLEP